MHAGHTLAIAMWAMTGLAIGLVALRLYTRIRIVRFVGIEDHLYVWTGIFMLVFAACIQVAVHFGLGRSFWTLSPDDSSRAIFWTYVANTFAISGNALAKLCMGFFLLRVVQLKGQKLVLWFLIVVTVATSVTLVVMLWNQTTPRKASWDVLRTPGEWNIQIQPMSVGLGGWSSACDFFFAIFPWLFIMWLKMPRREKILLASGMSLGVIAGACGVVRTVVLSRLKIDDFTLNFAPYFIWAGAEITVALICLGIPALRPFYLKQRGISTIGYGNHHHSQYSDPELPRFTMVDRKTKPEPSPDLSHITLDTPEPRNPHLSHITLEPPASPQRLEFHHQQQTTSNPTPHNTVPAQGHLRDSSSTGSSHTMVDSTVASPELEQHPLSYPHIYSRAAAAIARPPSVHNKDHHKRDHSGGTGDSITVDDILGFYDTGDGSQSRSKAQVNDNTQQQTYRPVLNQSASIRRKEQRITQVDFLLKNTRMGGSNAEERRMVRPQQDMHSRPWDGEGWPLRN
ncbi:hypothetical protein B0T21DRAFT_404330 [Apiosordaria backusii]|uniref:Rhodopsin domain-containing protein n=1 Tax=Apiosordaria backusii TaxID=314023 RepID=A0AA40DZ26_9PEZI|nr:hypothetical protein B0T21DRAFT_404330 [Apiosordaria backusii]